jgi:hypothetical protein
MVVQHLTGLSPITGITAAITSATVAVFRTWTWLRCSAAAEHARTGRLIAALLDVRSQDHAEVVRACAELEAAIASTANCATKPTRLAPRRRIRQPSHH